VGLAAHWQRRGLLAWLLWPLSLLFRALASLRRIAYRAGWKQRSHPGVPVVIVGNISVGGTGKTPLLIALTKLLTEHGYRVGIISRGYGGGSAHWPRPVSTDSDPAEVGDEPVLIATRTGCPMWVGPDRSAAADALVAESRPDLILSDDGLQHYALARDLEIAVIDAARGLGNRFCLPAGPLREPPSRLSSVDLVIHNGDDQQPHHFTLQADDAVSLLKAAEHRPLADFAGESVAALAGIGHPPRFFATLRAAGLQIQEQPRGDHHVWRAEEIAAFGEQTLLMTEKDAVKCRGFATENHWYLPVRAVLSEPLQRDFLQRIAQLLGH
jgi:tetraacyldisaccharide 4'-kinase